MEDWTAGYVADIGYTYGYYAELNPQRIQLAFLNAGLAAPTVRTACELGFGQGLSANLHAAASVVEWHGTDFNPAQAGFAQELAHAATSSAKLYDESFAEFAERDDLPEFDYIGLHGIWSWVSDDNRKIIVDFIRRKLKVGGVLYISYNTLPGWAGFAPVRNLLTQYAELMGTEGDGILNRIEGAIDFVEKLLDADPLYAKANPTVLDRVKKLKEQNRQYLAHEYFNRDWHPMYFADMAEWLKSAKLQFACSANYLDHVDALNLTAAQQALVKEIPDVTLRQTARDYCVNQQFRRDYWVKGARKMSAIEQTEAVRAIQVMLIQPRADVSLKVTGSLGEATMQNGVYEPILDFLSGHGCSSLSEIEQAVSGKATLAQILQAVIVLVGNGSLAVVQDRIGFEKTKVQCEKLNSHLIDKSRGMGEIGFLASPMIGGGVPVGRFQQLFLLAIRQGKQNPSDWAFVAWEYLSKQGQRIVKEGKRLESAEENLAELSTQAIEFAEKRLPILRALGVA